MPANIPWNEELETLLLHCIIAKGAHTCKGTKRVSETWCLVNDMFFEQDLLLGIRDAVYKKGEPRKLRDKFKSVMDHVQKKMDCGNLSAEEGEMSMLFKHAQTIVHEEAESDAQKEKSTTAKVAEFRQKLNATEEETFQRCGPLKRKLLNGEIMDNSKKDKKPPMSFEEHLIHMANCKEDKKAMHAEEEEFEVSFMRWINKIAEKTLSDLLSQGNIQDRYHDDIEDIGLKTLVSIYCTRGSNFSAKVFKDEVRAMELPMVICSKLYMSLQEWRREFEAAEKADAVIPTQIFFSDSPSMSSVGMGSTSGESNSTPKGTEAALT